VRSVADGDSFEMSSTTDCSDVIWEVRAPVALRIVSFSVRRAASSASSDAVCHAALREAPSTINITSTHTPTLTIATGRSDSVNRRTTPVRRLAMMRL
jgi:hypothetical protein